ncbi:MAG: RNA ligase (ATP) [Planctomycetaceae bacterium]
MRKLASIQTVSEVSSIPGADAIERLRILGWWIVAKKGEHSVGDRLVYCEIDSLLPEKPEFEFLRASCFKPAIEEGGQVLQRAGFRIKTMKLRGQVSQGICFPLSILPAETATDIGLDVTEALGIIKYEPPIPVGMGGRIKGVFPAFLPKTDEIRIQVLEQILERYRGMRFAVTEKLDGTSFTAFLHEGEFGLCSRNQWLDDTDMSNTLCRLAETLGLRSLLKRMQAEFGISPAIQGEVIGPGVQGNKYKLKEPELYVFNVLDAREYRLVDRTQQQEILKVSGLKSVPQIDVITLDHTVDQLVEMSIGTSVLNSSVQREGVVFRPESEIHDPDIGGRLSFKVINPRFLLKFDE